MRAAAVVEGSLDADPGHGFWAGVGLGVGAAALVAAALGHLLGVRLPF